MTLVDHFAAVEADFRRFYGLRLASEVFGPAPMSTRELRALMIALPRESALVSHELLGERADWGNAEELLATIAEVNHATMRLLAAVHSKPGADLPEQLRIRRPGDKTEPEEQRFATREEMAGFFGMGAVQVVREGE